MCVGWAGRSSVCPAFFERILMPTRDPDAQSAAPAGQQSDDRPSSMPFGKYKGWGISSLPQDYLSWLGDKADLRKDWLRNAVERERQRRHLGGDPTAPPPGASNDAPQPPSEERGGAPGLEPMPDNVFQVAKQVIDIGASHCLKAVEQDQNTDESHADLVREARVRLQQLLDEVGSHVVPTTDTDSSVPF